ncbi:MAG: penicillin-binding protein 2 [Solirubrobacterales bacterium]
MKPKEKEDKLRSFLYICFGLLSLLLIKLAFVQFVQNQKYETLATTNSMRLVVVKAPRGEMYDRKGRIIAKNRRVYSVTLTTMDLKDPKKVVKRLVELLGPQYPEVTVDALNEQIKKQQVRLFEPVTVIRDIDWAAVVRLEEHRTELPGVEVNVEPLRYYPEGTFAGHVLGYVHPIYDNSELAKYDELDYRVGDLVGKNGLEKIYESYLRGKDGARRVEVNVSGQPVRELVTLEPTGGNNLVLTIDKDLQKVMDQTMDQVMTNLQRSNPKAKAGAAVLINVKTGEVLAMSSRPNLDPNAFTKHMDQATLNYYFPQGKYNPLNPGATINRALQASYPPGSTFKPITGMAALESGRLDPATVRVTCRGAYWISPHIKCWGVHGTVDYYRGLAVSCNVFFQEAGRRAGKEMLVRVAREFGLGQKTGIDLPFEQTGLVPSPEWKRDLNAAIIDRKFETKRKQLEDKYANELAAASDEKEKAKLRRARDNARKLLEAQYKIEYRFNTVWQPFDTFNMSIGQGSNSYTVIQMTNYVAALANGGVRMKPYLVQKIVGPDGKTVKAFKPQIIGRVDLKPETLVETRKAMHNVATPGGTASYIFSGLPPTISGGAKTGTAQPGRRGDTSRDYHGVFIAFAPYEDPQIAYAGLIEYGYHGSTSAGLIAKAVFEQYFGVKNHLADVPNQAPTNDIDLIE